MKILGRIICRSLYLCLWVGVALYIWCLRSFLQGRCCFTPSCSHYCLEAFDLHPPLRALRLSLGRLSRCWSAGSCLWDPVPAPEAGTNLEEPPEIAEKNTPVRENCP